MLPGQFHLNVINSFKFISILVFFSIKLAIAGESFLFVVYKYLFEDYSKIIISYQF
jgi:hypothetical protein